MTGFPVVQEPTYTHAYECRLLGASWFSMVPIPLRKTERLAYSQSDGHPVEIGTQYVRIYC